MAIFHSYVTRGYQGNLMLVSSDPHASVRSQWLIAERLDGTARPGGAMACPEKTSKMTSARKLGKYGNHGNAFFYNIMIAIYI